MSEFSTRKDSSQYQWLLETVGRMGLKGGTAFKTLAGFGRDHVQRKIFHELTSNISVVVQFVGTELEIQRIVKLLVDEKLNVFYTKSPIEYEALEGAF
ncbi:MAG: DUF190 domain-containing protein [Proteobacteria bacterium]|nr:DUF190 domain-containing protein [Pseudomonadota bacterium]MDE3208416.1 DUF190 domain-containing protein [Pseudomonadota bacterium]